MDGDNHSIVWFEMQEKYFEENVIVLGKGITNILYIKTEFAKVCSGLEIFQVANTPRILTVLVP